eukprot:1355285-Pleurochrysis_carterae.AAC.2
MEAGRRTASRKRLGLGGGLEVSRKFIGKQFEAGARRNRAVDSPPPQGQVRCERPRNQGYSPVTNTAWRHNAGAHVHATVSTPVRARTHQRTHEVVVAHAQADAQVRLRARPRSRKHFTSAKTPWSSSAAVATSTTRSPSVSAYFCMAPAHTCQASARSLGGSERAGRNAAAGARRRTSRHMSAA